MSNRLNKGSPNFSNTTLKLIDYTHDDKIFHLVQKTQNKEYASTYSAFKKYIFVEKQQTIQENIDKMPKELNFKSVIDYFKYFKKEQIRMMGDFKEVNAPDCNISITREQAIQLLEDFIDDLKS